MLAFLKRNLVVLVVVGALLDVGVFLFQISLSNDQAALNARTECWESILDQAVIHRQTPAEKATLNAEALTCVALTPGLSK